MGKAPIIYAVTHKCASTSQWASAQDRGLYRATFGEAREFALQMPLIGHIRDPWDRLRSALNEPRFHRSKKFLELGTEDYVRYMVEEVNDNHFIPQHLVHKIQGLAVNVWRSFEDLVAHLPVHARKTLKPRQWDFSPEFITWFEETFAEDFQIRDAVLQPKA